jgi:uncharacterized membrane protein
MMYLTLAMHIATFFRVPFAITGKIILNELISISKVIAYATTTLARFTSKA